MSKCITNIKLSFDSLILKLLGISWGWAIGILILTVLRAQYKGEMHWLPTVTRKRRLLRSPSDSAHGSSFKHVRLELLPRKKMWLGIA